MSIELQAQSTPNPNAMKITANQMIFEGSGSTSVKKGDDTHHPLAQKLIAIDGVDNIFGFQDFVTVNKTADVEWDNLLPLIQKAFEEVYE
ncbi:NifU N-terminal domain-containing protein [Desertibacillus haloalkaliphilus]|uniref:NifU N-terminal domain-containing protein n=1 Tax=Desertibacillus haloalkaliphilus TaxID=1328930 RepID=UPI001C25BCB6|nr:NifU N-terminal domain-containing protein [Desertibacillus haloalkaliphilus]MBU8908355.1 NifU N-terminal domain-containing protein [Desertibacillus haloalkaliphilus]